MQSKMIGHRPRSCFEEDGGSRYAEIALARFEERLQGFSEGQDVISGQTYSLDQTLTVPAKTPLVFEVE